MTSNILYILLFFIGIFSIYYMFPCKKRWVLLFVANIVFYSSGGWGMTLLLLATILWSYVVAIMIEKSEKSVQKNWLRIGVITNIGVLLVFKYTNFFVQSFSQVFQYMGIENSSVALQLILPIGLSYYIFKIISYLIDVNNGKNAEYHIGYYAVYISFFPQILCGPIQRAEQFLEQLREGISYNKEYVNQGMQLILLGLFKKIVIANRLAVYIDTIWANPKSYPSLALLVASVLFSIQIYCDFSGYSDLAIGMGKLLGISCDKNFNLPYFAENVKEFWDRWHISLSSWLKDYVYIPLGGNRKGKWRQRRNILITFLISGLWHGDNWTYVIWGGMHGIWNICSKNKKGNHPIFKVINIFITFMGVTIAWIFFRAPNIESGIDFINHMIFSFSISYVDIQNAVLPFTKDNTCVAHALTAGVFIVILFVYEWKQWVNIEKYKVQKSANVLTSNWCMIMFLGLILFGMFGESSFLYAQF